MGMFASEWTLSTHALLTWSPHPLKHWGNTTKASFTLQQCNLFASGALMTVILSVYVKQVPRGGLCTRTQKKMVEFDSFGQGSNHFTLLSPKMTFMNMLCITRLGETHLVSVSFPKDFLSTEPKESNMLKWERQLHTRSTGTAEGRHSNDGGHMHKRTNCTPLTALLGHQASP